MYYNVMDFICILTGAYLIYAGVVMKTRDKIIASVVFGKGVDENSIRDRAGFINYLYIRLMLIGLVIALAGVVNIISDYRGGSGIVSLVMVGVFAGALVAYAKVSGKAMKEFAR